MPSPSQLGWPVAPVLSGALRRDLEVLAELFVAGLCPQRLYILAQLVPVEVKREGVEEQHFGDQAVQRHDAEFFEQVGQQHVVVRL